MALMTGAVGRSSSWNWPLRRERHLVLRVGHGERRDGRWLDGQASGVESDCDGGGRGDEDQCDLVPAQARCRGRRPVQTNLRTQLVRRRIGRVADTRSTSALICRFSASQYILKSPRSDQSGWSNVAGLFFSKT